MDLCTILSPFLNIFQQFIDLSFGVLSLVGIQAPQVTDLLSPILGCTTTT
ncbi:MAG: hypothetical protein MI923_10640 [Phycisphaerales bacterium]|nr:hypothetical protein [Phycisphaerales bacterium]